MKTTLPENEKTVWILKKKGPLPIREIAQEMKITVEGARFHLLKLEKDGLVKSHTESSGPGRPRQIWSLTNTGHARFPDTHAELTVNLIDIMRETLGDEAIHKVIEQHENRVLARYTTELAAITELEKRIAKLTEIRSREGYMAEYAKEKEAFLFIENHCPICAAAAVCKGFCQSELNIFKELLGKDVRVERIQHILSGERRCAYRIVQTLKS